jgi:hypothetical protein
MNNEQIKFCINQDNSHFSACGNFVCELGQSVEFDFIKNVPLGTNSNRSITHALRLIVVLPSKSSSVLALLSTKAVALIAKALVGGTSTCASGLLLLRTIALTSSSLDSGSLLSSSGAVINNWEGSFILVMSVNEGGRNTSTIALVRIYKDWEIRDVNADVIMKSSVQLESSIEIA